MNHYLIEFFDNESAPRYEFFIGEDENEGFPVAFALGGGFDDLAVDAVHEELERGPEGGGAAGLQVGRSEAAQLGEGDELLGVLKISILFI